VWAIELIVRLLGNVQKKLSNCPALRIGEESKVMVVIVGLREANAMPQLYVP